MPWCVCGTCPPTAHRRTLITCQSQQKGLSPTRHENGWYRLWADQEADLWGCKTHPDLHQAPKSVYWKLTREGLVVWVSMQTHPKVSMRQPQALQISCASACTAAAVLHKWFYGLKQLFLQHDLLDKTSRIWNCDESGFHSVTRVVGFLLHRGLAMYITSQGITSSR